MNYLNLDIIKQHLYIESGDTEYDTYLTQIGDVAEQVVENHVNQPLSNCLVDGVLPTPLIQSMLLMTGNLFNNREINAFANVNQIPFNYDYLLFKYIKY